MIRHTCRTLLPYALPCLFVASTGGAQQVDPSCFGPAIKPKIVCPGEETDPAAAANDPATYAWTVFAQINRPAFPGSPSDSRRVWETWKSADDNSNPTDAIYLNNGSAPNPWNVSTQPGSAVKPLSGIRQLELLQQQSAQTSQSVVPFFIPNNPLAEEVRTNRPAFNFILDNKLYNQQGQYQFASVHPEFDFPVAAKEVKAIWREAPAGLNAADYYSAKSGGKTYILVSMHVITKDLPFWFWSTFVHKDQNKDSRTGYVAPLPANQRIPPSLQGTPFVNYRLIAEQSQGPSGKLVPTGRGAQLDWITRTGEDTQLANPNIESGFEQNSSCITCHAHASIGIRSDGTVTYNNFPLSIGPLPASAMNVGGVRFYPLDFLWSLRNAQPAAAP